MLKVLIIDDSLIVRRQIEKVVKALGHTVTDTAKNGNEGIFMYKQHRPDLVTMDVTMPGMDGISTTQNIMMNDPRAKILMVTSNGQEEIVVDAIKFGAIGYLLKPVSEDSLKKAIDHIFQPDAPDDDDDDFYLFDEDFDEE
jgi:two-component system chemotaxis response regulator CheY